MTTPTASYYQNVRALLEKVMITQEHTIEVAAECIANCVRNGGIVYAFGCGHSGMMAQEMFYRAGGLVPVSAVFDERFMLHSGGRRSSQMERTEGLSNDLVARYEMTAKDVLLVFSTSGINPGPIDIVIAAKQIGIPVIGITSSQYSHVSSRHSTGKHLSDVVDICIDNHVPYGDAVYPIGGDGIRVSPVSTVIGAYIVNSIVATVAQQLYQNGSLPSVFLSGNVPGGAEHNQIEIEKYLSRIPVL